MAKGNQGNHSIVTWQDQYFDGQEEYICEQTYLNKKTDKTQKLMTKKENTQTLWLKYYAHQKHFREPFDPSL
ncbi:hypothetical protein [Paenibacillus tuaregi]|uniref:hypothetical protein n=1 Tax=Paenibacillus tuaregi TaxID=1816681 RepID=UPI000837C497|nr:hypothetical protein [Paenibacillus tuaregi]